MMLPSSTLVESARGPTRQLAPRPNHQSTPRQKVPHLNAQPRAITPPANQGDESSVEDGLSLSHRDFREAEQSRVFWQAKISQEVRQVLQVSTEAVHGLRSMQLQVHEIQEGLQKVTAPREVAPHLAPERAHPPPEPTPRDKDSVGGDSRSLARQEMLHDSMNRSSRELANRLEELHDRLDEVHASNMRRFEEVMQQMAGSFEHRDRLEAVEARFSRQEEAAYAARQDVLQRVNSERISEKNITAHTPPAQDPLVEFGKMSSETGNGSVERTTKKSNPRNSLAALSSITHLQLSRELSMGGESGDELEDVDFLDMGESPVELMLRYINRFSLVIVLTHTIFMGVTLDISIEYWHRHESPPGWIRGIEITFTAAYCIETLLRVVLEKRQFYRGPNAAWNMFDIIIIFFGFMENIHDVHNASILRIFRILRIMKTARAMRSMKSLRVWRVITSPEVLSPMMWSSGMLIGFLFICALVFTTFAGDFTSDATAEQEAEKVRLLELYGSVIRTMKTIFSAVTGGEPWRELSKPLGVISDTVLALFWVVIFITIFGLMNTVTAVYCEAIVYNSNADRLSFDSKRNDKIQLKVLRSLLLEEVLESNGKIKFRDVMKVLKGNGAPVLTHLGLELWVAKALFKLLDPENSREIDVDEFIYGLLHLKGNPQNIHIASLEHQSKKIIVTVQSVVTLLEQTVAPQLANLLAQNALDRPSTRKSFDGRDGSHYEEPQRLVTTTF